MNKSFIVKHEYFFDNSVLWKNSRGEGLTIAIEWEHSDESNRLSQQFSVIFTYTSCRFENCFINISLTSSGNNIGNK